MLFPSVVFLGTWVLVSSAPQLLLPQCAHYCENGIGEYYCCDESMAGLDYQGSMIGINKGRCPRIRALCDSTVNDLADGYIPPRHCLRDYDCPAQDKCCPDICFGRRVCKPSTALTEYF